MVVAPVLIGLLIIWAAGRYYGHSLEYQLTQRYPRSTSGVIVGAEEIAIAGTNGAAVLLVHGAGDTPQTMGRLATALHGRGYTVLAPLLVGHGRTLADFSVHSADEWYDQVRASYEKLRAGHSWVSVVGLSMGGALSARLAAETPDLPALVLASPYLTMSAVGNVVAQTSWLWGLFVPYVNTSSNLSVLDAEARGRSLSYGAMSAPALRGLRLSAKRGWQSLGGIRAPTLVIQSKTDNRVATRATERAYELLGAKEKRIEWVEGAGHVITVDFGWQHVATAIGDWMDSHHRA
jgi:carboxylesterase